MSFLDTVKNLFSKHQDKLPENMNSVEDLTSKLPEDMNTVDEIKAKASEVLEQHEEAIDKVTDAIPGEADDQLVEKAKDALN